MFVDYKKVLRIALTTPWMAGFFTKIGFIVRLAGCNLKPIFVKNPALNYLFQLLISSKFKPNLRKLRKKCTKIAKFAQILEKVA